MSNFQLYKQTPRNEFRTEKTLFRTNEIYMNIHIRRSTFGGSSGRAAAAAAFALAFDTDASEKCSNEASTQVMGVN